MAKKKIVEIPQETDAPAVEALKELKPVATVPIEQVETLLFVRSRGRFADGGLAQDFAKYGYPVIWPNDTVRKIPNWLYRKCVNSGGRFDLE